MGLVKTLVNECNRDISSTILLSNRQLAGWALSKAEDTKPDANMCSSAIIGQAFMQLLRCD